MPPSAKEIPIDFEHRADPADLIEWMDEPCSYEDFRQCLVDLEQVNHLTLAYRPTLNFLDRLIALSDPRQRLHIVDIGSGGGDMLRRVAAWSAHRGVRVELTGIDLNPYAARVARERSSARLGFKWITADLFSYAPSNGIDVVISSLFTHHLSDPEIVRFLVWMESIASRGWFVNDLCRERLPFRLFEIVAKAARWHRFVQHDGPVSFRRAFREDDWDRMITAAGIPAGMVHLARKMPARLCVTRIK
jgi:SAM-dependent methyltransferase